VQGWGIVRNWGRREDTGTTVRTEAVEESVSVEVSVSPVVSSGNPPNGGNLANRPFKNSCGCSSITSIRNDRRAQWMTISNHLSDLTFYTHTVRRLNLEVLMYNYYYHYMIHTLLSPSSVVYSLPFLLPLVFRGILLHGHIDITKQHNMSSHNRRNPRLCIIIPYSSAPPPKKGY